MGFKRGESTLEGIAGFELTAGVVEAAELNGDLQFLSAYNVELVRLKKKE